jgi:hypothetical protein
LRFFSKEAGKKFDNEFIHLARQVYFENDKKVKIKRQINITTQSSLIEEKEYVEYGEKLKKNTYHSWCNSAAKLTKLILDENLRRELKKNGLQRAKEKFDYIIQASKVAHIYHTL